ncbi:hypothetical protein [Gryllotalpicola protaetiae]|uniref:Uncharacterized protein n=1 Tax=Gryllotalpicola protaetiae TaxID=2419771 RepID=A0A387BR33_9MICO|nr:hypothetical protein [Gryllotalpicola protaetiae]AYG03520.1 hypothetical protein D7I44_08205 [Gryllotalpicola protaetiae]
MTDVAADAQQRGEVRARVRAAGADCLLLRRLLPELNTWSGPAGWAFGLRVEGLRERIESAHAALVAAEAGL